jgi:hypothetical protein
MEPSEASKPVENAKRLWGPATQTIVVVAIGAAIGVALAFLGPGPTGDPFFPPPGGPRHPGERHFFSYEGIDMVLSTTGISLLMALLVVQVRAYRETKAKFALGLVVVLAALVLQAVLTSPIIFGAFGNTLGALGPFLLFADLFKLVAFSVFLYLSLQ